jgi:geranylgeranyl diphosphate synthase type I
VSPDLSPYLDAIEDDLRATLESSEPAVAPFYQMMRYHMGWLDAHFQPVEAARGKRLRPLLCLLANEAAGGDWRRALPAASAIELVHNFSLIHDDIEDGSDTRRHRLTVWKLWGLAQGVNTGDAMWTLSRLSLLRLRALGHASEIVLAAAERLERTCLELCTGQYLDISFEQRDAVSDAVSVAEYERMISGKTGALIEGAVTIGALLAGVDPAPLEAWSAFGRAMGRAFQIADDILGIWGDPKVTGKSAASDILERKKTLPVLHALQREAAAGSAGAGEGALADLYARPSLTEADVPAVLAELERWGAQAHAQAEAERHQALALEHLAATGAGGPAAEALRALASGVARRAS